MFGAPMEPTPKHCRRLRRAMAAELARAARGLRLPGHPKPYFLSYLVRIVDGFNVWGRYGSIFHEESFRDVDCNAQVRVGSYRFDQSFDGNLGKDSNDRESANWVEGPRDLDPTGLRYVLWRLTQFKYEEALQDYYEKRKILVEQHLDQRAPSFTREPPHRHEEPIRPFRPPKPRWRELVRDASALFGRRRRVIDPYVRLQGVRVIRLFVNSEGAAFQSEDRFFELSLRAWTLAPEGSYLDAGRWFHARRLRDLPGRERTLEAVETISRELAELRASPPMEPYAGPALLGGNAAGLVFHEALGHRLEGERLLSRDEGRTFEGKLGRRILPKGLDIYDDPSLAVYRGRRLFGHYRVDDEGVPARRAQLVRDGILVGFLQSRTPIPGSRRSNGHGRTERQQDPMARMANLIVEPRDGRPREELVEELGRLVVERGLPYGLIVERVSGGETRTDRYDFQAFKGTPTEAYLYDPHSHRLTRVRDLQFIGTPLAVVQRIEAFGRELDTDHSFCWAESGSVPVSTVAPPMLVADLEVQRATKNHYRPPLLPRPPIPRRRPAT